LKNFAFAIVFVCPPFLKKIILKWLSGAKIGHHVQFGWFSTISGGHIEIGDYAEVRAFSVIRCAGEVRIGAYAVISNFVMIYGAEVLFWGTMPTSARNAGSMPTRRCGSGAHQRSGLGA
jgi:hypothetical protein